jgi:hypothetical protein
METARTLYDQYTFAKDHIHDDLQFDMIKRIEAYRKDIDNYNSYGLSKSAKVISSQPNIPSIKS